MAGLALKERGFTLLEVLIVSTVLSILLAVAVPSFRELMLNSRRTTTVNELVTALNLARSETLKRGVSVAVCPSPDGVACGNNWSLGWMALVDADCDAVIDAAPAPDTQVKYFPARGTVQTVTAASALVCFRPFNQRVQGNGTFKVCDSRGADKARAVVVAASGRVTLESSVATCP